MTVLIDCLADQNLHKIQKLDLDLNLTTFGGVVLWPKLAVVERGGRLAKFNLAYLGATL